MTIELYIQGQRVELFKDESITITESIQNVKDIEKVFTAFTHETKRKIQMENSVNSFDLEYSYSYCINFINLKHRYSLVVECPYSLSLFSVS